MQGILLAAGFGSRFQAVGDTEQDKLLAYLPNQQQSILWHSANALITALPNSMAVIQPQQIERKKILQDLGFVIIESTNAAHGMGYAISDVVRASPNVCGWLVALADMPWVTAELIKIISDRIIDQHSIVAPSFNGKRGQPVAFGTAWFEHLCALKGDIGARELLQTSPIDLIDWHDNSIHRDVDTKLDMI